MELRKCAKDFRFEGLDFVAGEWVWTVQGQPVAKSDGRLVNGRLFVVHSFYGEWEGEWLDRETTLVDHIAEAMAPAEKAWMAEILAADCRY